MNNLKQYDITSEEYREYVIGESVYKVDHPITLYISESGNHRVWDGEMVHRIPVTGNTIIRWKPKDSNDPVQF